MSPAVSKSRARSIAQIVLIAIAVAALVLAALMRWWIPDRVIKTPLTVDTALVLHGSGQILDENGKLVDESFLGTQILQADSKASNDTNVVLNAYSCLLKGVTSASEANCQQITKDPSDPSLLALSDRVAVSRKTGLAVQGYNANIDGTPVDHDSALTYRFPIGTQKKTYPFFNTFLQQAYDAKYVGTEPFGGLSVYKFVTATPTVDNVVISGAGSDAIKGSYQDTITLYVEPRTGTIVNASEHQVRKTTDGATALDVTVGNMAPTDTEVVVGPDGPRKISTPLGLAKDGIDKIDLLKVKAPLTLLGLGVLAALGAAFLMWPPFRRKDKPGLAPSKPSLAPAN
jgi:hypothetical protein